MTSIIVPRPRTSTEQRPVRSRSLRALAVAARLERDKNTEAPPGHSTRIRAA